MYTQLYKDPLAVQYLQTVQSHKLNNVCKLYNVFKHCNAYYITGRSCTNCTMHPKPHYSMQEEAIACKKTVLMFTNCTNVYKLYECLPMFTNCTNCTNLCIVCIHKH